MDVTPRLRRSSAEPDLLTTGEAAKELGVSAKTVLRWINDGLLLARRTRTGGQYRLEREALERFKVEQQEIRPKINQEDGLRR
ncbi:MAG: helix-turn-helix domain-containing protein [Chloroflexota bacterium]